MPVKGYLHPDIPVRAQIGWAKETLLTVIDEHLYDEENSGEWVPDDVDHLLRQRNRIAKLFGLPEIRGFAKP